ncbi:MAG: c-type cytochrome domain-containing protein [Gammaproteobacteria bacterium]
MNIRSRLGYIMFSLTLSACAFEPTISYQSDIYPILKDNCLQCHVSPNGIGFLKTGLNMASYESLMHGTIYGPVIVPGDSRRSVLNKLVEGRAGNYMRMPHDKKDPLTKEEIEVLRLWVNQDAINN